MKHVVTACDQVRASRGGATTAGADGSRVAGLARNCRLSLPGQCGRIPGARVPAGPSRGVRAPPPPSLKDTPGPRSRERLVAGRTDANLASVSGAQPLMDTDIDTHTHTHTCTCMHTPTQVHSVSTAACVYTPAEIHQEVHTQAHIRAQSQTQQTVAVAMRKECMAAH